MRLIKLIIILYKELGFLLHSHEGSYYEKPLLCRSTLVERMPVLDEATFIGRRDGSFPGATSTPTAPSFSLPNGVAKPAAPLVDLLDLSTDDVPAPSSSGGDVLQDLLGVDLSSASQQSGWCL